MSGVSALSGLKDDTAFIKEVEWTPLSLTDLLLAAHIAIIREDETASAEQLIGLWGKRKCFGVVGRYRGWPIALVMASAEQRSQAKLLQWAELPEVGHTTALWVSMKLFESNLPDCVKSVVMTTTDSPAALGLHQNLKQVGFKCIKVVPRHFPNGDDGYLFHKRVGENPIGEEPLGV